MDTEKRERVVRARMRLRERFSAEMAQTPARSDARPLGTGPPNRHGMPRLPVDQVETQKWPVLDLGHHPAIAATAWTLTIEGACAAPLTLTWDDLMAMDQVDDVSDFHCVTRWSRLDIRWRGVRLKDLLARSEPHEDARFVMCHGADDYTTNLPLCEALKDDVLLVHAADGAPLAVEHGGPVRMITPQLYAWKGAKWITRIDLMTEDQPGFWEVRGYSNSAHPWRGDRYS